MVSLRAELAEAKAEIVELRAQLNRNSQNSSKPPSSDLPGTRPQPDKRKKKKRKRGGQSGHQRRLPPEPEHIDYVKQYRPATCKHCQADLCHGPLTGSVVNHYVYALPDIRPIVTDHQCLDVACLACGGVTAAELPPDVPRGEYDPSVQAMTAMVRGELRQSMRQTSSFMTKLMHVPMSTAMVAKLQEKVSQALAAPHQQAVKYVQAYERHHADETGWRQDNKTAWLWVTVCGLVTVFLVRASRGADAAKDLLGAAFRGVLTTDRWASYGWVSATMRQLCWSHLRRDFKSFLDYEPEAKLVGERLLSEVRRMFRSWNKVRDGTITRATFQLAMKPLRRRVLALLEQGSRLPGRKVSGMCKQILKLQAALFTFVDVQGVEPTNNVAERALRFAVLWRKGSFGSDSAKGSRFVERFLTVRATLRAQKLDLYTYLKDACSAALHGASAPDLLSVVNPIAAENAAAA